MSNSMSHLVCDLEELQVTEEQLDVRQAGTGLLTLRHFLVLKEEFCQVHSTYRQTDNFWLFSCLMLHYAGLSLAVCCLLLSSSGII